MSMTFKTKVVETKGESKFVTGTGTAGQAGSASAAYKPTLWTFDMDMIPVAGDMVTIKIPVAGVSSGVWMSVNNGTNYYPIATIGKGRLTTHYSKGYVITLIYETGFTTTLYGNTKDGAAAGASAADYTLDRWRVFNFYDSGNTTNSAGTSNKTGTKLFLAGATSQTNGVTTYSNSNVYIGTDNCLYSNGAKVLTAHQNISGKADKVSNATNGNFAALDSNGNLTDSGHKHSDYLTSHQDISGKQDKTDGNLTTTATTVVGAINEHETDIILLNSNKIDKPTSVAAGKFLQTDSNGDAVWGNAASPTDVANAVTDWLDDNIPTGQTVVVDQSLTVSGAAADAKVVGDEVSDLESVINEFGTWGPQSKNKCIIEDSAGMSGWWGITWKIEDGILKINGKSTGNLLIKVTGTAASSISYESSWWNDSIDLPLNTPLFLSVSLLSGSETMRPILSGFRQAQGGNPVLSTYAPLNVNGISISSGLNYIAFSISNGTTFTNAEYGLQIEKGISATAYINCNGQQFYPNSRIRIVNKNDITAYQTIQSAVNDCNDGDEVLVYPGSYEEAIDMGVKFIHLHGFDPYNTIIWNDIGDYDHCPLYVGNALVEGITFHEINNPNKDYSGITRGPYAVHLDQRWGGLKTVTFRNCRFFNDFGGDIGTGVIDGVHIIIDSCYGESMIVNSTVMQVHGDTTGTGYATIDILNTTFKVAQSGNGRGLLFSNGGSEYNIGTKIKFRINNSFLTRYYNNCGELIELDETSFGNNISELNN